MESRTEKLLGEILSVNKRIESRMNEQGQKAGSPGSASPSSDVISGISGNIVKSLNEIKKETIKTNQLLNSIDKNIIALGKNRSGSDLSKGDGDNLSKIIKETATAVSKIAKVSDGKLEIISDTIKGVVMVALLRDPKTGQKFATEKDMQEGERAMKILQGISSGILKFGANMALFAILAIPAAAGAMLFAVTIRGILAILSPTKFSEDTERAINSLNKLGIGVALFGVTMAAFALTGSLVAKGALTFITVVSAMSISLLILHGTLNLGKKMGILSSDGAKSSGTPLGTLYQLGMAVATFGITMILFGLVKNQVYAGMGVFAATMGIALGALLAIHLITGMGKDRTGKGNSPLGSLWKLGIGIATFGAVMAIMGIPQVAALITKGAEVALMAMLALGVGLLIFSTKAAERGSNTMLRAVIPLAAIVVTLAAYSLIANRLSWESIGMLGAVIVGLGAAMAVAGMGPTPGFIAAGSKSMILASAALGIITTSLLIYSKAADKLTWENIGMLGAVIVGLGTSMAAAGAVSFLIIPGAAAMLLAAGALYPITKSLEVFKRIEWTAGDTETLKFAVTGVRQAFASGGPIEWSRAGYGALMANKMGKSLVGLAQGIESFANMSFTEFDYDPKTGKMIPVKTVKLTDSDITSAAHNIGAVLTAMIQPLAEFGDMIEGSAKSGNFFQRMGIQKSNVEKGIKSFGTLGDGLVNMASGVQDWANMTVTEWGVKDNEIVPIRKRKILPGEITAATTNIATVLSALIEPITEFGGIFEGKKGRGLFGFGKTDIEKGLQSFSLVSDSISNLATGVQNWVDMKIVTYKVKDGQLVPSDVNQISEPELDRAAKNLTSVLNTLVTPIIEWGNRLDRSERKKLDRGFKYIKETNAAIDDMVKMIKTSTDEIQKLSKNANIGELNTFADWFTRFTNINFTYFSGGFKRFPGDLKDLHKAFSPFTKGKTSEQFDLFTKNITDLGKSHSEFDQFVTSFDRMTVSMERFTNNFKGFMPEGITAFSMWTKTLSDAIEIGRAADDGLMDSFLDATNKAISSGFQFGKNLLGRGESETSDQDKASIIDETIKQEAKGDPKMEILIHTIEKLQNEINGLKTIMSGEMQVYVTGIDNNASIKISDL